MINQAPNWSSNSSTIQNLEAHPNPGTEAPRVKLFLGGLTLRVDKQKLLNAFIKAFNITSKALKNDIKIMAKLGYGFISIPEEFVGLIEPQIEHAKLCIDGKPIQVKMALKRKDARIKIENERGTKLYVGGISLEISKAELIEYFGLFGGLDYVNLVMSSKSNLPRGFAFIKFDSQSPAEKVLNIKYHKIKNIVLVARKSMPKPKGSHVVPNQEKEKAGKNSYINQSPEFYSNFPQTQQQAMYRQNPPQSCSSQKYHENNYEYYVKSYFEHCEYYPYFPMEFDEYVDYISKNAQQ